MYQSQKYKSSQKKKTHSVRVKQKDVSIKEEIVGIRTGSNFTQE